MDTREQETGNTEPQSAPVAEQGYMLLGLIVAIALILIALSVAATEIAFSLRREREVEAVHRGNQYVRAIREYYLKNKHYPGSLEQLENTNNIRYLRQRYIDPMTGKDDWRMIAVGQNKTTVKGFFGQPLTGLPTGGGLGSAAGLASPGLGGAGGPGSPGTTAVSGTGATSGAGGAAGSAAASAAGSAAGGAAAGTGAGAAGPTDSSGAAGTLGSAGGLASAGGLGGTPGTSGPIMGVGLGATGSSLIELNEQTTYQSWEFLYDPRVEQLKAAAALNAGAGSAAAGGLGQTPSGFGQAPGGVGGASPTGTPGSTGPGSTGAGPAGGTPTTQP